MEVEYYKLLSVDNTTNLVAFEDFDNTQNIIEYIWDIINNCVSSEGDREYLFEPSLQTMQNHINDIIINNNRDQICEQVAKKLLAVERDINIRIAHMDKKIPKGMLMISYAKMTDSDYKVIITKADYTEFIEELSGNKKSGLPTKKKIFKSFIMNVTIDDGYEIGTILTYDSNTTTKAVYWWKTFLELKEVRDDELNTLNAYRAIKNVILKPISQKHKQDYLCLRNLTIAYFRGEGEFDLKHYKDDIIGSYHPFDSTLKISDLKVKIEKLPQKYHFDLVFQKKPDVVKDKFKDVIPLTDEIDLKIKQDILDISKIIKSKKDDEGNKYIMILSQEGYEYAEGLQRNQDE